jgi:hypothetical protein
MLLFVGGLVFVLVSAAPFGGPHAQPKDSQATSLNAVKTDELAATGYDDHALELAATNVQFVVTITNSHLTVRPNVKTKQTVSWRRLPGALQRSQSLRVSKLFISIT